MIKFWEKASGKPYKHTSTSESVPDRVTGVEPSEDIKKYGGEFVNGIWILNRKSPLRITEIKEELQKIDLETIRPLRAKLQNKAVKKDEDKLNKLESRAELLRIELNEMEI